MLPIIITYYYLLLMINHFPDRQAQPERDPQGPGSVRAGARAGWVEGLSQVHGVQKPKGP